MKNAKILVESLNQVFLNALMIMLGAHKHLQGLGQLPLVRYEDYGFSEDEDKRLGEFCKNLEMRDKILLLQCAAEVYPNIIDELYCCIVIGMSYDKMNKKKFVALDRKDFYAYRKKTLAVFRAALQACNRYPF